MLSVAAVLSAAERPVLLPEPRQCLWGAPGEIFAFADSSDHAATLVAAPEVPEELVRLVASELEEYLGVRMSRTAGSSSEVPALQLSLDARLCDGRPEAYRLSVTPKAIELAGRDERGLVNGLMTILQLAEKSSSDGCIQLPVVEILDWPTMAQRSYFFELNGNGDVGGQYSYEWLRRCIRRLCAYYKCNLVGLGEAGSGCFPLKRFPYLQWLPRGLSEAQLRELIAEARKYRMEPYPVVELFGHAEGLFLNHNQVQTDAFGTIDLPGGGKVFEFAETDAKGNIGNAVCLSSPVLRDVARDVFDSVCELFGTPEYFHIGMDEAMPVGTCPRCRGRNTAELFAEYLNWCHAELKARGVKHVMMWSDELLDHQQFPNAPANSNLNRKVNWFGTEREANYVTHPALDQLTREMLIVYWDYSGKAPEPIPHFQEKGFTVWAAPWKDERATLATIRDAQRFGCSGMIGTAWTFSYWRGAVTTVSAEVAWQGAGTLREFDRTTRLHLDMLPPRPSEFHRTVVHPLELPGNASCQELFKKAGVKCPKPLPKEWPVGKVDYRLDGTLLGIATPDADARLELPELAVLPVHDRAVGMAFLQSALRCPVTGEGVPAEMTVCYEDGTRTVIPLKNGVNLGSIQEPSPDNDLIRMAYGWTTDARLVEWPAGRLPLQLQSWEWRNPFPEKRIDHLEWRMAPDTGKAFLLFAVSLVQGMP